MVPSLPWVSAQDCSGLYLADELLQDEDGTEEKTSSVRAHVEPSGPLLGRHARRQ